MKHFFAQFKLTSLPTPVQVWHAMERGAEYIHDLLCRFAAGLPGLPGLVRRGAKAAALWLSHTETAQECRAIWHWMENRAEAIHALPYRFAAWLPTAPERWRQFWQRTAAWMEKKDITPRLRLFVPLCLAGALFTLCIRPVTQGEITYLLTDGENAPVGIFGKADFDREFSGLTVTAEDSSHDAQLVLHEGQQVQVTANGQSQQVTTRRETVANLLRRLGIVCSEGDMVVVDTAGKTPAISIQQEYHVDWQANLPTDYDTQRVPNYLMREGKEKVVEEGQQGSFLLNFRDIYRNGVKDTTEMVSHEITESKPEVVEYGTRVDEVKRSDRIKKVVYNADGSGYLLFKSGKTMTFSRRVTCNATAYSIGSWTASGLPTKVGHIAVDPKIFPYGTRFYIYTDDGYLVYGNAVAADCGSGIKGYELDLWFETYDEACWFGRRDCTVFVLN